MIKRTKNWERKFRETIETARDRPFLWGHHDCMTFASSVIQAITGAPDILGKWRGRYKSAKDFKNLCNLWENGFKQAAEDLLADFKVIHPKKAQRGDVALVEQNGREAMGIVNGSTVIVLAEDGIFSISRNLIKQAWGVGHE